MSESKRKCWYMIQTPTITECFAFLRIDKNSKFEIMRRNEVCFMCFNVGHLSQECEFKKAFDVIAGQ